MLPHLNRQAIAEAALDPRPYADHLRRCEECSLQVELYRLAHSPEPLIDAPSQAISGAAELAVALPRLSLGRLIATLTFDSWAEARLVGVRGLGPDSERRLRFEADMLRFDLRAERTGESWQLAAQVLDMSGHDRRFQLKAGSRKISRRDDAFYIWTTNRPPKQLTLISDDTTVLLPEITWTDPLKS